MSDEAQGKVTILPKKLSFTVTVILFVLSGISLAQKVQTLTHQPPDGAGIGFLLTDGTVMFQGNGLTDWYKLTPDKTGSYLNGTWSRLADLPSNYATDAFSSAVLPDGRLVVSGGEYISGVFTLSNQSEIYDPKANTWTNIPPPKGWYDIGDSPSAVLPNGQFLVGRKTNKNVALLNAKTLTWTSGTLPGKSDFNAEEGWTLMPDGTILTYDVKNSPNSERLIPSKREWISAGSTIVDLHSPPSVGCLTYGDHNQYTYCPPGEVGPAILRPDGTVFATGSYSTAGPGHTAIYTPGANLLDTGTWTVGPDFPSGDNAGDSFAALLPNGNVLVLGNSGTSYEFDGKKLIPGPTTYGSLITLPTGQVFVGSSPAQLYTSTGTYQAAWAPTVTTFPSSVTRGSTYKITGTQFNGLSQAAAFGDEYETATNYPMVRITNKATGHVFYARTHDHSTMGVATGSTPVFTNFDVPSGMETGLSSLEVVANGIPSTPVSLTVN